MAEHFYEDSCQCEKCNAVRDRDRFAVAALQGLIAGDKTDTVGRRMAEYARMAYGFADEMIKYRDQK